MKRILYKKRQSSKNNRKVISIHERSEEKECKTHVRKSFAYVVTRPSKEETNLTTPEIYIKKSFDSKLKEEKFSFRVRGAFFVKQEQELFQVNFCHTLKIELVWKDKHFSPKKSATLT